MLEHKPQSFKVGDEVLWMGDQWVIKLLEGEKVRLVSTSDPKKTEVAKTFDLSHVAIYDELADEFDDDVMRNAFGPDGKYKRGPKR